MKLSDEQIKVILQQTNPELAPDPLLSDWVMNGISAPSQEQQKIQLTQRKTKTWVWISLSLTACFLLSTVIILTTRTPPPPNSTSTILLSGMIVGVLLFAQRLLAYLAVQRKYALKRPQ